MAHRTFKTTRSRALTLGLALMLVIVGLGAERTVEAARHVTHAAKQTKSAAPGTTLTIWYSTDDPAERIWSQGLAKRYEGLHRSVQVRLVDYSFEDINTKLQLALSAGKPPDLAYVTPRGPGIPAYVGAHVLLDLTGAARAHGWASALRPDLLAAYNQPFHYFGEPNGHVVAVPTALAAVAILYNPRILAGLHARVPTSLSALEADMARARRAGYTPLGIGNGDGWVGDDWYQTIVNALVPPGQLQPELRLDRHFSFRGRPYLSAAQMLQSFARHNYLTKDFGGLDAQEGIDEFFRGRTLFQLVSSSENSQIAQDEQETKLPIGVFPFPTSWGRPVMPQSGYEGWIVPRKAAHPTGAIDFISFLLSKSTGEFIAQNGQLPARRDVFTSSRQPAWLRQYVQALDESVPGVYLDAAPIANLNATMEANVQLLLQRYEPPSFLVKAMQEVYASRGKHGSTARIDGEF